MMTRDAFVARGDGRQLSVVAAVIGVGYLLLLTTSMGHIDYDTWAALWAVPLLFVGSLVTLRRLRPRIGTASLVPLLSLALVARALGAVIRYAVIYGVYDGRADASTYHNAGVYIGRQFRNGDFHLELGGGSASTNFMKIVTGVIYALIGPSKIGGFAVFAAAAFWGSYLMFRAFQIAVPSGDARRYAILICFLPSMLFWPSSIGKEAWMMLAIGLTLYGAARLFAHLPHALIPMLLGVAACLGVRPHIAVVLVAAIGVGYLVRPRPERVKTGGRFRKVVGIVALVVLATVLAQRMQESLNLESANSVTDALDFAENRTDEGGSSFTAARIRSPADVPWAVITVLFRPLPHEANNAQMAVSALEGVGLMALLVVCLRRVARAPRLAFRQPYVALALLYSTIFIYAFSTFGNFGLLTRQRVQLLPLVLVLPCLGLAARSEAASAPVARREVRTR